MKKLWIFAIAFAMAFTGCINDASDDENSYTPQVKSSSSIYQTVIRSSSSVRPIYISSSSITIILPPSSSSQVTLEDVCDKAAENVIFNSTRTYESADDVCPDYYDYLTNVVSMTQDDAFYCAYYEGCQTIERKKKACNMSTYDAGYSTEYLKSLCGKYKAQGYSGFSDCDCSLIGTETNTITNSYFSPTGCSNVTCSETSRSCVEQKQAELTKQGVGRGSGACASIKSYCGCK